jgi:5'-phosphate synthase pdxT subunit
MVRNISDRPLTVGVLALQGDFEKHIEALKSAGGEGVEIRTVGDLREVEGLIIPGGESTTVGKLMSRYGLDKAIKDLSTIGLPIWGTCMGMIMMADRIENSDQPSLNLLDITVKRNAFGRQIDSFETDIYFEPLNSNIHAVFIRAPIVTQIGASVQTLATFENKIVCVKQNNLLGSSFHPELTDDPRVHVYFIKMVEKYIENKE